MVVKNLLEHKANNNADKFFEEIKRFLPRLRGYIAQRLHIEERKGTIRKNFYKPDDILDEVILEIYNKISQECTEEKLKQELFRAAINKLNSIAKREVKEKISFDELIDRELEELEEKFTVNADGELVLTEELDDISYHQQDYELHYIFVDNDIERNLLPLLDKKVSEELSESQRNAFWKLYSILPAQSKTIIELHVFAGLSGDEIAPILEVKQERVDSVISAFTGKLKNLSK